MFLFRTVLVFLNEQKIKKLRRFMPAEKELSKYIYYIVYTI